MFTEAAWSDVIVAVDRAYSELVAYQERLEAQNKELDDLRRFMASVLSSVWDLLVVVDKAHLIERTGGPIERILGQGHPAKISMRVDDLVAPDARDRLKNVIDKVILARQAETLEIHVVTDYSPTPL